MFLTTYFLCGIMDVFSGTLKGLGYSVTPMVLALTGACGFRIFWRFLIFPTFFGDTPVGLLICFPISWIITLTMFAIALIIVWQKLKASGKFTSDDLKETANAQ
jgi:Na+-driven multidrug efflux pump